jgi:sugar/nucleoside kinase (ribokinase family)
VSRLAARVGGSPPERATALSNAVAGVVIQHPGALVAGEISPLQRPSRS